MHDDELVRILADAIAADNEAVVSAIVGVTHRAGLRTAFDPDQPRDEFGRWTDTGGGSARGRSEPRERRIGRPSSDYTPSRPEGHDTKERFRTPAGDYTPERKQLHDEIVDRFLAGRTPVANPTAVVLGGGPASGKSTLEKAEKLSEGNKVLVNADDIKELLPEFREGKARGDAHASSFVHEESSDVSKLLTRVAAEKGYNIVLDGTGDASVEKLGGKVAALRAAGHQVVGKYVSLPTDMAVKLAHERGLKRGRFVPETYLRETHAAVSRTFAAALQQGLFDRADLYDTTEQGNMRKVASSVGKNVTIHNEALWRTFLAKGAER
jgi:hypothetical protein